MRKLKKRLAALGIGLAVMAASAMSLSASAINPDYVNWNDAQYKPYTGKFQVTNTYARAYDLYWNVDQVKSFRSESGQYSLEFEFRPDNTDPHKIWQSCTNLDSNFPFACYEFDTDDVTIVFPNTKNVNKETNYYGKMNLVKQNNEFIVTDMPYTFEVELGGVWIQGFDSDPLKYTRYNDAENNARGGRIHSW